MGSNLAFHVLSRLNIKDLVLVDIAGTLAKGIALDLEDTRGFLHFDTNITGTSNMHHIKNSDIVVITCGLPRKAGMTRYDLFKTNSKITMDVSAKIQRFAPAAIVIVVTNPLDLIVFVATKYTGFDRRRVLGMGSSLDSLRLINLIYKQVKVSPSQINALVCGPHSKDMIPLLPLVTIKGLALSKFLPEDKISILKKNVKLRGKEIVDYLKNRSAFFAPGLSCYNLLEAVCCDKKSVIPVSILLKGEYGLKNVCLGVPCVVGRSGIERILEIDLDKNDKKDLLDMGKVFTQCLKTAGK